MYRCTTCGQHFTDIPDGAVQITPNQRRVNTFRFADGTVHSLRELKVSAAQHAHLHQMSKKIWCEHCFPPKQEPQPEPPVVEQTQIVQPPVPEHNLPEQPLVQEVVAEIEDESELTSITTLSAAFNRIRK